MRVIFAGTPDFSTPTLQALIDSSHEVCCVLTQPDKPKGRGQKLSLSPVKSLALAHEIDVLQPKTLKNDAIYEQLKAYKADVMVVVAYGLILPEKVLTLCPYGAINVHASLLPNYRGAAPIQASLLNGDTQSGVTIMQMDKGLDTGDMLYLATCKIDEKDNSQSLHDKLAQLGGPALVTTLKAIAEGTVTPVKQDDSKASYAGKIAKTDGLIDWQKSVEEIERKIRAYYGWPSCFSYVNDKRFRIWKAQVIDETMQGDAGTIKHIDKHSIEVFCNPGILRLDEIQFDGGKRLPVEAILNANQADFIVGKKLDISCND